MTYDDYDIDLVFPKSGLKCHLDPLFRPWRPGVWIQCEHLLLLKNGLVKICQSTVGHKKYLLQVHLLYLCAGRVASVGAVLGLVMKASWALHKWCMSHYLWFMEGGGGVCSVCCLHWCMVWKKPHSASTEITTHLLLHYKQIFS